MDGDEDQDTYAYQTPNIGFSTTNTWKLEEKFDTFHDRLTAAVNGDQENIPTLQPEEELGYIVEEEDAEDAEDTLCKAIIGYKTGITKLVTEIRRERLDIEGYQDKIKEKRRDIQFHETQRHNLERNTEETNVLAANLTADGIALDEQLIAGYEQLIAKNKQLIVFKGSRGVRLCLKNITYCHKTVSSQLDVYKTKGNESTGTVYSTEGLDEERFDVQMKPSPSKTAEAQRVPSEHQGEALESELCKGLTADNVEELVAFQRFVAGLFEKGNANITEMMPSTTRLLQSYYGNITQRARWTLTDWLTPAGKTGKLSLTNQLFAPSFGESLISFTLPPPWSPASN